MEEVITNDERRLYVVVYVLYVTQQVTQGFTYMNTVYPIS